MKFLAIISCILLFSSCAVNSLTGKSQLNLVSQEEMLSLSNSQYKDYLSKAKIIENTKSAELVNRVGNNIVKAINAYYKEKNITNQLLSYNWEYHLVQDSQVNAWCMPGGKIVVYSGILPVTQDETSLAIVMGHEVSHALLEHGRKRMSEGLVQQLGASVLSVALEKKSKDVQDIFMKSYGIGTEIGLMLPFSRADELEADKYGLIFAAKAGYDPRKAVDFWQRMSKMNTGQKPLELLSTHPSDERRIEKIKENLPEALLHYKK